MTLTLDAQLEQRIQREIELGHGRDAVEVIKRALDLSAGEEDFWTEKDRTELDRSIDLAMAQAERGEVTSGKELREDYERRRAARVAQEVGSLETAAEFFAKRAAKAKGKGMMHYLVNAPEISE